MASYAIVNGVDNGVERCADSSVNCNQVFAFMRSPFYRFALSALFAVMVLAGCGGGEDGSSTPPPATKVAVTAGCYSAGYAGYSSSALGCGILSTSGDPVFDFKLNQEIFIQSTFWGGLPASVYLFDECPGEINALSLPARVILLGRNISIRAIVSTGSDLPIAGVLAHEWGHQAQFAFGWMNQNTPTVRPTELEADAFSGYYMGLVKSWAGPELNAYFQLLFSLGTYDFNNPGHHGTPQERLAAGGLGMQVAAQAIQTRTNFTYQQLHDMFTRSIKSAIYNGDELKVEPFVDDPVVATTLARLDLTWTRSVAAGISSVETLAMPSASQSVRSRLFPRAD